MELNLPRASKPGEAPGSSTVTKPLLVKLVAMMALEFAVFGAWFATLGLVLATHGAAPIIGQAYLLAAAAAIVSPLLMGAIGDRFMARRNLLSLLHIVSAGLIAFIPGAVQGGHHALTLLLVLATMLFFQPTLGLVNCIALAELGPDQRWFPYVRVFGPVGWAGAGFLVGALDLSASTGVFYASALCSVLLAAVALTLPYRSPTAATAALSLGDLIGAKAFVLFRHRGFTALMICALLTSISLGTYNTFVSSYLAALGVKNVAGVLAMGQLSELVFIVTIPWALARIGMKWALLLGMGLWSIRFVLFILAAQGPVELAYLSVVLHGVCVDYFIVIAAMYIAQCATAEVAAQAQSWLVLMISGFGAAIGSTAAGAIHGWAVLPNAAQGAVAWQPLLLLPVVLGIITSVVWISLFPSTHVGGPTAARHD